MVLRLRLRRTFICRVLPRLHRRIRLFPAMVSIQILALARCRRQFDLFARRLDLQKWLSLQTLLRRPRRLGLELVFGFGGVGVSSCSPLEFHTHTHTQIPRSAFSTKLKIAPITLSGASYMPNAHWLRGCDAAAQAVIVPIPAGCAGDSLARSSRP